MGVLPARARERELVDGVPREPEHRGKEGDGGEHHEQDGKRCADCEPADERHADEEQAEQRDHDRATGEQHGPAARVDRVHDGLFGVEALVQRLAVPGADEQRVVDADPDPDHRGDLRRERRDVQHSREEADDREADADAEQRGHDRQAHGEERAERDQEDDDRRENADELARGHRLLGEHAARELDLHDVGVRVLRDRPHVGRKIDRHVVRLHVEQDLGVGDLAVLRDEPAPGRLVRARHAHDVRLLAQLREHRLHRLPDFGIVDRTVAARFEHHVAGVTAARELLLQHVERRLRLRARQRERLQEVAADRLRRGCSPR